MLKSQEPFMRPPQFVVFLVICVQVSLYCFMGLQIQRDSTWKTLDFISFYGAGRLMRQGEPGKIYDIDSQRKIQQEIVGEGYGEPLLFIHPPYWVPLLALISIDDYSDAYIFWIMVLLLFVMLCGKVIYNYLLYSGWDKVSVWLGTLGCLTFFPVFISILEGQDTVFTLLGLLLWAAALLRDRWALSGFGLALSTLSPITVGILAGPTLLARRRAGYWFILCTVSLLLYGLILVGVQGARDFFNLLALTSHGSFYGFHWVDMYNLLGSMVRAFPGLSGETARIIAWMFTFVSIALICLFWWQGRAQIRMEHLAVAVIIATIMSPHVYIHSLSYLIVAFLAMMRLLYDSDSKMLAVTFVPAVSLIFMLLMFFMPQFVFVFLNCLMIFMIFVFYFQLARTFRLQSEG